MDAEVARPLDRRVLARRRVVVDALEEVGEQGLRGVAAAVHLERVEVGLDEAEPRQGRQRGVAARRRRREGCGVALDGIGLHEEVVELGEPRGPVRREHAVRLAAAGQHLAALEDHVVLRRVQGDAAIGEGAARARVAGERVRVVVVIGEHRLDVKLDREGDDLVGAVAVANQEANVRHAVRRAEPGQVGGEGVDALDDELDATIGARQLVEDRAVVDERAPDLARRPQRVIERGVVGDAQVAAEPDQRRVEGLLHGRQVCRKAVRGAGRRAGSDGTE